MRREKPYESEAGAARMSLAWEGGTALCSSAGDEKKRNCLGGQRGQKCDRRTRA